MEENIKLNQAEQKKFDLITQNLEETIGEEDLKRLIKNKTKLVHYIGIEISGLVHLGNASTLFKIADLQEAGVKTTIYMADWHTWINDKLNGDYDFIKKVGNQYFKKAMQAGVEVMGGNPDKINFILGSELYHNNDKYWQTVVEISKNLTLSRVLKSISIMGRKEDKSQPFAWLIYPPMQIADIMEMGTNIAHAGMDQRKIHVVAREVAESLKIQYLKNSEGNKIKPVCLHNKLILGLQAPKTWPIPESTTEKDIDQIRTEMKMSKSIPGSAIFIHDSEEEIKTKIKEAFCPPKHVKLNPLLDWCENLIFPLKGNITIKRDEKYGGTFTAKTYQELKDRFASGDLYPLDLKNNLANILIEILEPARRAFGDNDSKELIQEIRNIKKKR